MRYYKDITFLLIIVLAIGAYFSRFFYPELQFCVCPDFGMGDVWYYNYPIKNFLAESLQNGRLPLWNKDIGMGFPIFAEGQIGLFYIPNLLFKLLNTPFAFNLQYFLSFVIAAIGMFFYLRVLTLNRIAALFGSLTLAYSGYFITQISHLNLLQSASLIPWIFIVVEKLLKRKTALLVSLLAFLLSQQFFAGYAQISFITVLGFTGYMVIRRIIEAKDRKIITLARQIGKDGIMLGISFVIMYGLIAVQLLPSQELLRLSVRDGGLTPTQASSFSYPVRHLKTFLNPFALGNPKDGSYAIMDGSFFWENTGYIGIIPLLLAGFAFLYKKERKRVTAMFFLLVVFMVLMLGKYGPLYFISALPPFNLFRVPSRFLLLVVFFLIVLASFGFQFVYQSLQKRYSHTPVTVGMTLLTILSVIHLYTVWDDYHLLEPVDRWIEKPPLATFIENNNQAGSTRILYNRRPDSIEAYYQKYGWKELNPYRYIRNTLYPNSNILWDISSLGIYVGNIETKRLIYFYSLLAPDEGLDRYLYIANVKYIISQDEITEKAINMIYTEPSPHEEIKPIQLYEIDNSPQRAYMVFQSKQAETLRDFKDLTSAAEFNSEKTVVLEKNGPEIDQRTVDVAWDITWITDEHNQLELGVTSEKEGLLVLADSYYPGWKATVDGIETTIYPANLNNRVIVVPEGEHIVAFAYEPASFKLGGIVSIASHSFVKPVHRRTLL